MHEMIYVSQRKLHSFQPGQTRFGFFRRVRETEIKAPLGIGAKLALSEDTVRRNPDLAGVLRHIDSSARSARWYESSELEAGDWVHFEARLNYQIVDVRSAIDSEATSVLFFWDAPDGQVDPPCRLLLHGSAEHLTGSTSTEKLDQREHSLAPSAAYGFVRALNALAGDSWDGGELWQLSMLLNRLETGYSRKFAAWMAGYARVTVNGRSELRGKEGSQPRILVASPLYVELIDAPDAS